MKLTTFEIYKYLYQTFPLNALITTISEFYGDEFKSPKDLEDFLISHGVFVEQRERYLRVAFRK